MNTLLIVAVIVLLLVALVALRKALRKKVQRNTLATSLETLKNTETYQFMQQLQNAMGVNATQHGKVPGAYGEFGYGATNPIPTKGIPGSISYLAKLRTEAEVKVEYKRRGSTKAENINHPVDMYKISAKGEYVCMLHLCPYYKENSTVAPKGFKALSTEEVYGFMKPK